MSALLLAMMVAGAAPSTSLRAAPSELTLEGGQETVGLGWAPGRSWFAEAHYAWQDSYVDLRGGRTFTLFEAGVFGADLQAASSLTALTRGPFDLGAGLHGVARLRLTLSFLHATLGVQAGGELFARELRLRAPLRLLLGVSVPIGAFQLGVGGRAGADLSPSFAPTVRYEAMGWIGYTFSATPRG